MNRPLLLTLKGGLFAAAMFAAAPLTAATITENFTSDPYPGLAGSGWATTWTDYRQGGNNTATFGVTPSVQSANPLDAADPNHLRVSYSYTVAGTGTSTVTNAGVRRTYDALTVDPAKAHTISFLFRVDSAPSGAYSIYLRGSDEIISSTGHSGWTLEWNSARGWRAYDGNGAGTVIMRYIDTISQTVGTTYQVTINMEPENGQWGVAISDGTQSDGVDGLSFRTTGNTLDTALGFSASATDVGSTVDFSIDQINIAPIPEPGTAMTLLGGGVAFAASRLLKRRPTK